MDFFGYMFVIFIIVCAINIIKDFSQNRYDSNRYDYRSKETIKGEIAENEVNEILQEICKVNHECQYVEDIMINDSQIDHIFIYRDTVFVIETKNYNGIIFGDHYRRRWTVKLPYQKGITFLNPLYQNETHIRALRTKYRDLFPFNYKFINVVFFYNKVEDYLHINMEGTRGKHIVSSKRELIKLMSLYYNADSTIGDNASIAAKLQEEGAYTQDQMNAHINNINNKYYSKEETNSDL